MLPRPWCGPCFQPFGVCSWEGIASPMTIPGLIFEDLPILFMNLLLLWGLFDGLEPRKGSRGRDALAGSPWGSPPRAPGYVLVGVCFPVGGRGPAVAHWAQVFGGICSGGRKVPWGRVTSLHRVTIVCIAGSQV